MNKKLILTCEHAGNQVPEAYRTLFEKEKAALETHRGYDIGALELTRSFSQKLGVKPYVHEVTRLLIDLNRSLHNPSAFSEFVRPLDKETKRSIIEEYYEPYRKNIENQIADEIGSGKYILHLGIHTFTPELNRTARKTDIGLLFDPRHSGEKSFCDNWKLLMKENYDLKIRYNYPYRGVMDGFTTYLRKQFPSRHYTGIEIEVNQKFPLSVNTGRWEKIQEVLGETFYHTFIEWH